jgi:hypothetical protein
LHWQQEVFKELRVNAFDSRAPRCRGSVYELEDMRRFRSPACDLLLTSALDCQRVSDYLDCQVALAYWARASRAFVEADEQLAGESDTNDHFFLAEGAKCFVGPGCSDEVVKIEQTATRSDRQDKKV